MTSWLVFQNNFILRNSWVVNFAEIIKIATNILKQLLKTQKDLKELDIMC